MSGFFQTFQNLIAAVTPSLDLKDTDCTDSDINAQVYCNATDTGTGTEDVDVWLKQQIAGALTTFLYADADGDIQVGSASQGLCIVGKSAGDISFTQTAITSSSGTATINWGLGNKASHSLSENVTYTFTAPAGAANLTLKVVQDSSDRTITWPGAVKWSGGTAPTLTSGSGKIDIITFYYDGTDYYSTFSQDFS